MLEIFMIQWFAKIDALHSRVQNYTSEVSSGSQRISLFLVLLFCLLSVTFLNPLTVYAQSASTGIIQGTVRDDTTGNPLPAVNVLLVGTPYGTMTNTEGFYLLRNIPAGEHVVQFKYVGYREVLMEEVVVLPSLRTTVDVRLEPTPVEMPAIVVTADRPLIQKDVTGTMHRVAYVTVQHLPVDTFQEIVELQPGVTSGGHIRGGRTGETLYIMDGVPIQDPTSGISAVGLPKSAITELNVHTGGFDAEFGNALSGVVHIITRRGSNSPEAMFRYDRDDLGEPFGGTEHSDRSQFEAMFGGPIVKNRAFYFVAADMNRSNTRWWQDFQFTTLKPPHASRWNAFARTDLYLSQSLRISTQGLISHDWEQSYEWRWRFNLEGLPAGWRDSGRLALTLNHMISPAVFYDLQLAYFTISRGLGEGTREDLEGRPLWTYDNFLQYVAPDGGERLWWFRGDQRIYNGRGALTAQIGRHRLKAGFEAALYHLESDLLKVEPQTTLYGLPLTDTTPMDFSHDYDYWPRTGSLFLQDTYESDNGLILNIGLRYDWLDPRASRPTVEWIPTTEEEFQQEITRWVPADLKTQISPRIGLAFPLPARTYFLFNYGEFFQVPLFDQLYSGLNLDLTRGLRVLVGNPDLEHERTKSYEFSFRKELDERSVGSLTYFFKESYNLIDTKTYLAADSRALEDGFTQYVNSPLARASGLEIACERRIVAGFGIKAAYSFMVARGHAETELSGLNYLQWGFEPPRRMYYLSWDQRHTISTQIQGEIAGTSIDVIGRYNSPRPYTYAPSGSGVLPEGTTVTPNNERMQDILQIDARIRRALPLTLGARKVMFIIYCDVRNLTDRKNVVWIASDGRIGGELGDPGAYRTGRRTRIGVEVRF